MSIAHCTTPWKASYFGLSDGRLEVADARRPVEAGEQVKGWGIPSFAVDACRLPVGYDDISTANLVAVASHPTLNDLHDHNQIPCNTGCRVLPRVLELAQHFARNRAEIVAHRDFSHFPEQGPEHRGTGLNVFHMWPALAETSCGTEKQAGVWAALPDA
jgi:hypothetical protein